MTIHDNKVKKIVIVMPAYNAAKTLSKTYQDIPQQYQRNVILVDDGSHDNTVAVAKRLGIKTISHPQNRGYGGNQKTCYTMALNEDADIVIMIHPDYQYDATLIEKLIQPIQEETYDIMLGSRIKTREVAIRGGMPLYKYVGNRVLTILENFILGKRLSEYHTGFRAFSKDVLLKLPFHRFSDDFVFDQEILISAIREGYNIGEIHVPVRYSPDASSINFIRSIKYGLETYLFIIDKMRIFSSPIFRQRT